jgi:glycosyltransferase involved in cell wall biosynthesis
VIFEAWDAGVVPVVFAGSGGAAEVVAAADGGILYEAQEPQSLARALERAVSLTREEAERLVRNGRAWMAHNCNPVTYADVISSILSSV